MERVISCEQARQMDLVDFLEKLGFCPQKIRNRDYWYLSPLRDEKTPSFKVNRKLNVWYDHGAGVGGNLVDFGILYFNCSVSDLLQKLSGLPLSNHFSFHLPEERKDRQQAGHGHPVAGEKKEEDESKIQIVAVGPVRSPALVRYLDKRCIPIEIAEQYCREVDFLLYGKRHNVIGFENNAGGYELRSEKFKGSSSPKACTFIDNGQENVAVFEGFFSFLSFQELARDQSLPLTNCLVLNSLAFFQRAREKMEDHRQVYLYLDRDLPGQQHTLQALQWNKEKYIDRSHFYKHHKDLNDWLVTSDYRRQQAPRTGRRL